MDSVYHIGIAQTLFAAFIIALKTNRSRADIVLAFWLFSIALELTHSLLNFFHVPRLPDLVIFPFCYGPFIFLYTQFMVKPNQKFTRKQFIHFTPVLFFLLIPLFWKGNINIETNDFFVNGNTTYLGMANFAFFLFSILYYFPVTLKLIKNYKQSITDQFSYENEANTLNWLNTITWILFITLLMDEVLQLAFVLANINPFNPVVLFHFVTIFIAFSISFYGFRQPDIFAKHVFERERKTPTTKDNHDLEELANKLQLHMNTDKPYLNQELTLHEIAGNLQTSTHQLSKAINTQFKKNFFTFINEYRVQEAQERMISKEYQNLTLLAVAFDSGFNSKSSFNDLFKKQCGMTPSAYRKQHTVKAI